MSEFEEQAAKNADLSRWEWDKSRQQKWEEAASDIQALYKRWRDSVSTELHDEVYLGPISSIDRIPVQFIVREVYETMFDDVWQRAFSKPDTGVVVTGQPGIGKTYFLWYALIRLIKERQPVAFAIDSRVYLFYDDDVWFTVAQYNIFPTAKLFTDFKENWPLLFLLIDLDMSASEPIPRLLAEKGVFPIQASSPNPNRFKTWSKVRNAALWGLPLWQETELNKALRLQPQYQNFRASLEPLLTDLKKSEGLEPELGEAVDVVAQWQEKKARLLHELSVDEGSTEAATEVGEGEDKIFEVDMTTIDGALRVLVHAAVQRSGSIARDVFETIFDPQSADAKRNEAIDSVTYKDLKELAKAFQASNLFPDQTISHRIVAVNPAPPSAANSQFAYRRIREEWTIDYRSVQIAREMVKKLEKVKDERLVETFELFRSSAQSSTLASWIHEHIANRKLCTGARRDLILFRMRGDLSVDAPILDIDFEKDIAKDCPQLPEGDRILVNFQAEALSNLADNTYYVPERLNFPFFDSFLVERRAPDSTDPQLILWLFQMSTSPTHGGSREGYTSVRRIIKSLKSSFGTTVAKNEDGKRVKRQKRDIEIIVRYVYVTPREEEHTKYQWRCPGGWTKHTAIYDHRGEFYCLRIPLPAGTGDV